MRNRAFIIKLLFLIIFLLIGILIGIGDISNSYALNLKSDEIDTQKMSKETSIPVAEIKLRLGDKSVTTADEARLAWSLTSPGSKERKEAFNKWIDLAKTVKEIKRVLEETNKGTDSYNRVLLKWIEIADTSAETLAIFQQTPENSTEKQLAFEKMAGFYKKK